MSAAGAAMAGVLDAPAQTPPAASNAGAAPWPRRLCPECLAAMAGAPRGKLFCTPEHKRAYNNRWLKRGGVVAALYAAARITRDGTQGSEARRTVGKLCRTDSRQAVQLWKEEDAEAGRMDAVEYMALRYRHGLVEIIR